MRHVSPAGAGHVAQDANSQPAAGVAVIVIVNGLIALAIPEASVSRHSGVHMSSVVSLTVPGCVQVLVAAYGSPVFAVSVPPPRIDASASTKACALAASAITPREGEGEARGSRGFLRASSCNGTLWPLRPRFRVFAHGADASFDSRFLVTNVASYALRS